MDSSTYSHSQGNAGAGGTIQLVRDALSAAIALTWLPAERITKVGGDRARLELETVSGLRLACRIEARDDALILRGIVHGLPEAAPRPLAADSALSRDYAAGGLVLFHANSALPADDAFQRPRWRAAGWTLEFLPLTARSASVRPDGGDTIAGVVYPPHCGRTGGVPFAFALVAAPAAEFATAWRALAVREGVPGPHRPEDRQQVLSIATAPTLFALNPLDAERAPALLDWAAGAGFRSILLHCPIWAATDGTYAPNLANWPRGWADLRALVVAARQRGLAIGLHTMTTSIHNADSLVTPVPDPRLLCVWETKLAADVAAADSVLTLTDPPVGLSRRADYMSFGMTVLVDQELIDYGVASEPDRSLAECRRGAFGTRPAAHRHGARVRYLFRCFGEFALDPESSLADEVAANIARAFRETGAEMIYFDDSEAMPEPYRAHVSAFHERVWRAIGRPGLHVQASSTGPFGQFLLGRMGQQDTAIYKRALLDGVIVPASGKYLKAGVVPDFGWFEIVQGDLDRVATSLDDMDCLMARVVGAGGGVTVFGSVPQIGFSLYQRCTARLGEWRQAVLAGIPAATRAAMAVPGREFRPVPAAGGRVAVRETRPLRGTWTADAEGRVRLACDNPGPEQPLAMTVSLRAPLAALGDPRNIVLFDGAQPRPLPVYGRALETPSASTGGGVSLPWRAARCAPAASGDAPIWPAVDSDGPFAGWRLLLPASADLTSHRALAVRYTVVGDVQAALIKLMADPSGFSRGVDFPLPPGHGAHAVVDPAVEPELRFRHAWPDSWFTSFLGVPFSRIAGVEILLSGLACPGEFVLEQVEALRELPLPGPWTLIVEANGRTSDPTPGLPWDGVLDVSPGAGAASVVIRERSGALLCGYDCGAARWPVLRRGPNALTLSGLPPGARLDVRIDCLL